MATPLTEILDASPFVGLAVVNVHTGYNASIEFADGHWSPFEFAGTASEAIRKCFRLHGEEPAPPEYLPALSPPPY